jgi:hypothetical protein
MSKILSLDKDALLYYEEKPVDLIDDLFIFPAKKFIHGVALDHYQRDFLNELPKSNRIAIESGHGCHGYDTPILMYDGTTKMVQDVVVGDILMGDDSTPRRVLKLVRGQEDLYKIRYSDKTSYIVNKSHIMCLVASRTHGKQVKGSKIDVPLSEYLKWSAHKQRTNIGYKAYRGQLEEKQFKVEPLGVGAYYGFAVDGNSRYLLGDFTVTHNCGKSTCFTFAAAWFALVYNNDYTTTKVNLIAPTYNQLAKVLWPEFKRWISLSSISHLFELRAKDIYIKAKNVLTTINQFSPKDENKVQGQHAPNLLWECDEAFGIDNEDLWPTIEGTLTEPNNKIIIAGQHTKIYGYCHEAFHKDKDSWTRLRFNSEKSTLAKKEYCARIARVFGKDSDLYRVRVLGMEPRGNPDSFLQLEDVAAARQREVEHGDFLEMGVDVARMGDDLFVVATRAGFHVFPLCTCGKTDTDKMEELVLQELRKYRRMTGIKTPCRIKIGDSGGWAGGLIDKLSKNKQDNIKVIPINEAGPGDGETYFDNISLMFGEFKDVLDQIQLPDDDDLEGQLISRQFSHQTKRDKMLRKIESKDDYKKRHHESPDKADAVLFCFTKAAPAVRVLHAYNPTDSNMNKNFEIKWEDIYAYQVMVFAVLIQDKAGLYGNLFYFSKQAQVLRVYDEIFRPAPAVEEVIFDLKNKAQVSLRKDGERPFLNYVWINDDVLKIGSDVKNDFRRAGIRLRTSKYQEDLGAKLQINRMFRSGHLVVHSMCDDTDFQYRNWTVKANGPDKGYPLCQALCVAVSELKSMREFKAPESDAPYSPVGRMKHDGMYQAGMPVEIKRQRKKWQPTMDDWLTR